MIDETRRAYIPLRLNWLVYGRKYTAVECATDKSMSIVNVKISSAPIWHT